MDMFNNNLITEAVRELTSRASQIAKKLQKVTGEVEGIPDIPTPKTTDRGKFLKVKANANEYMLDSVPNEVPVPTIADAGKVIGVNDSGAYELVTASGGSSFELLASEEYTVNTTSTTVTQLDVIEIPFNKITDPNTIIWVHIRDKAGKRNGYFYGSDGIIQNYIRYNQSIDPDTQTTTNASIMKSAIGFDSLGFAKYAFSGTHQIYVSNFGYTTNVKGEITLSTKFSGSYGTIDGTYKCDIYAINQFTDVF